MSVPFDSVPLISNLTEIRMKRLLLCMVAGLVLPGMIGCSTPWNVRVRKHVTISNEQIARLAKLPLGLAGEKDVVSILGEPSYRMPRPDPKAVRKTFKAAGEDVPVTLREGNKQTGHDLIFNYSTSSKAKGTPVCFVMVFFDDGRYRGYLDQRVEAALPTDQIASAAPLVGGRVRSEQLVKVLGAPSRKGERPGGGSLWGYRFHAPSDLRDIGVQYVIFTWSVRADGRTDRRRMKPEFLWTYSYGSADPTYTKHWKDYRALVREYSAERQEHRKQQKELTSGPEVDRVMRIARRLLSAAPADLKPLIFHVLEDDTPNAFVIPTKDGRTALCLYTGILRLLPKDDPLAFVLAHELGHHMEKHLLLPVNDFVRMSTKRGNPPDPKFLKWVQINEHTADVRGMELMIRAGYKPAGAIRVIDALEKTETLELPARLTRFSTHPIHKARCKLMRWYLEFLSSPSDRQGALQPGG